jgi:hypothetical protein
MLDWKLYVAAVTALVSAGIALGAIWYLSTV